MYKITLSLLERITLPQILPAQGSYIDNLVTQALAKKLTLLVEELELYAITDLPNNMIGWNDKGAKASFDFTLTEREYNILKLALETADTSKVLPTSLNTIFAQICKPSIPEDLK